MGDRENQSATGLNVNDKGEEAVRIVFGRLDKTASSSPSRHFSHQRVLERQRTDHNDIKVNGNRLRVWCDLTTDGGSKLSFVDAIRETGASCIHTAVIFYYDIFPQTAITL